MYFSHLVICQSHDADDEQNIQPTNHIINDNYIVKIHASTGITKCEVNQVLNKVDESS